jgi:hypothetical protein
VQEMIQVPKKTHTGVENRLGSDTACHGCCTL